MKHKTREQISYNMRQVKNKDSKIELLLRHEMWNRGLRYRKNVLSVYGKPDIAFIGKKVAVFVDSEFWHGFDWEIKQAEIKNNRDFWISKIEKNIERDARVNSFLRREGWIVLRFWGKEIQKNTVGCVDTIEAALKERENAIKNN